MLNYELKFEKGLLFIKLLGNIDSNNFKELKISLTNLINDNQFCFIVFNLYETKINKFLINLINKINQQVKNYNGKIILCNKEYDINLKKYHTFNSEYTILKEIKI